MRIQIVRADRIDHEHDIVRVTFSDTALVTIEYRDGRQTTIHRDEYDELVVEDGDRP